MHMSINCWCTELLLGLETPISKCWSNSKRSFSCKSLNSRCEVGAGPVQGIQELRSCINEGKPKWTKYKHSDALTRRYQSITFCFKINAWQMENKKQIYHEMAQQTCSHQIVSINQRQKLASVLFTHVPASSVSSRLCWNIRARHKLNETQTPFRLAKSVSREWSSSSFHTKSQAIPQQHQIQHHTISVNYTGTGKLCKQDSFRFDTIFLSFPTLLLIGPLFLLRFLFICFWWPPLPATRHHSLHQMKSCNNHAMVICMVNSQTAAVPIWTCF